MKIHLIRHTTPDIEPGICYGQSDLALADSYQEEISEVLSKLEPHYDLVYTSPLKRCRILADKLSADHYQTDDRLLEYDFGDWEMLHWDKISDQHARRWMEDYVNTQTPNGESLVQMQERVLDVWRCISVQGPNNAAIVTHSGVIRIICAHLRQRSLKEMFSQELDFGDVVQIDIQENQVFTLNKL